MIAKKRPLGRHNRTRKTSVAERTIHHNRLVKCFEASGLSQSGLARKLNITQEAVCQWLSKPTGFPSKKNLPEVAFYLQTTVDYLMTGNHPLGKQHPYIKIIDFIKDLKSTKHGLRSWDELRNRTPIGEYVERPDHIKKYADILEGEPSPIRLDTSMLDFFIYYLGLSHVASNSRLCEKFRIAAKDQQNAFEQRFMQLHRGLRDGADPKKNYWGKRRKLRRVMLRINRALREFENR